MEPDLFDPAPVDPAKPGPTVREICAARGRRPGKDTLPPIDVDQVYTKLFKKPTRA